MFKYIVLTLIGIVLFPGLAVCSGNAPEFSVIHATSMARSAPGHSFDTPTTVSSKTIGPAGSGDSATKQVGSPEPVYDSKGEFLGFFTREKIPQKAPAAPKKGISLHSFSGPQGGLEIFLANLWIGLFAFFILFYAITDGADLGLGMLTLLSRSHEERDLMIGAITSTWHINQTWLVVLGGMVFGAFPFFYGLVFSALYIPIMAMLFALIIRGVALDFHEHSQDKKLTALLFGVGSLLVTITQGYALGGFLGGIKAHGNGVFAGGVWDWFSPFSGLIVAAMIAGFLLLGAAFLIMKTEGDLQQMGYKYAFVSALVLGPLSAGVYLWMLAKHPHMVHTWTSFPSLVWVAAGMLLTLASGALLLVGIRRRYTNAPFFLTGATIFFAFADVSLALYPEMIPKVIFTTRQIVEAASSTSTLVFMSIVAAVVIPLILLYNGYNQFWVFRGKVTSYYREDSEK